MNGLKKPSISFEKITFKLEHLRFYLEKFKLWIFSLVSLVKKHHKTSFLVKISVSKITLVHFATYRSIIS